MTQANILELAKQGDVKAIAALMNRQLQPKGITAKVALNDSCLQIMLESAQVPDQQALVKWVRKSIAGLGATSIERVKIYGRQTGEEFPAWSQEFEIVAQIKLPSPAVEKGTKSQYPAFGLESEKSKNPSVKQNSKKSVSSTSQKASQKLTPEERFANWAFITLLLLSILFLFVNFWLAVVTLIATCVVSTATPEGKAAAAKQKLEAQQKAEALVEVSTVKQTIPQTTTTESEVRCPKKAEALLEVSTVKQTIPQITTTESEVRCPKCGSTQLTANKKGFSLGKAVVGGVLTGGVGLIGGFWGSNQVMVNCLRCGHRWQPGK
jgi:DNA-directed RNA polymerase subunit RPC12/RpoP